MIARFVAVAVLVSAAASCGDGPAPISDLITVEGYVHAGPVCPVVQDPPDPRCADRPVEGATLVIVDLDGENVATATTAADGTFTVRLPAGTYTAEPQPVEGLMGTADRLQFEVGSSPVSLDFSYDTGIR